MKILFDQGTPVPLRRYLEDHIVSTAYEQGWSNLSNGELIQKAEENNYEILITTDQNLKYQQNLRERHISIVILCSTSWPKIRLQVEEIQRIITAITPGDYVEGKVHLNVGRLAEGSRGYKIGVGGEFQSRPSRLKLIAPFNKLTGTIYPVLTPP